MLPTITVDIGTTSVKLGMFDACGRMLASAKARTPTTGDEWGEIYDLDALTGSVAAFVTGLPEAQRATVERIAITGVGESGGLVRPDISLASPMILWHDHRGAELIAGLDASTRAELYGITGLPANPNYGLSKVAWALAHADDADDAQWLNVAEYLAAVMSGRRWSEYSLASRTLALDLARGSWSPEAAATLGVDVGSFPDLHPASEGAPLTSEYAAATGLGGQVRVHVAGHDHMVGAVGADLRRGEMLNSTGTTEGILFLRAAPSLGEDAAAAKLANGIACTGSDYTLFASIPTGGSAFATLQSMLGLDASALVAVLDALHGRYLAGGIDLSRVPIVVPQFRGSPPPAKDAAARGIVAGLGSDATADEIVFGTFLGMVLQFADVLDLFPDRPERIKVIGPASANPLWLQLKADLLGVPLSVSRFPEVVSRGAQALASDLPGAWADCAPFDVEPDPDRHTALAGWVTGVRAAWEHLKGMPS